MNKQLSNKLDEEGGGEKIYVAVRLGGSSYSAVQISILYLYRHCGIEQASHVKSGLSLYCKGLKSKGGKLVRDIGLEVTEGKKPMNLQVYKYLAKMFLENDKKDHIFARVFLVLYW